MEHSSIISAKNNKNKKSNSSNGEKVQRQALSDEDINALNRIQDVDVQLSLINERITSIVEQLQLYENDIIKHKNKKDSLAKTYIRIKNWYSLFKEQKVAFDQIYEKSKLFLTKNCEHNWEKDWVETSIDKMVHIEFCSKCFVTRTVQ